MIMDLQVETNRQALYIYFIVEELGLEIILNGSSPLNLTQRHGHLMNSTWGFGNPGLDQEEDAPFFLRGGGAPNFMGGRCP